MKIEIIKNCKVEGVSKKSGDVIEVPQHIGDKLIARSFAQVPKPKAKDK